MPFCQASPAWESYSDGVGTLQTPRGVEGVTVRVLRLGKAEIKKKAVSTKGECHTVDVHGRCNN